MPIQNRDDAVEVETQIASIFAAPPDGRTNTIRRLFVETLDFSGASGQVRLADAAANAVLPDAAERIAVLDGVQVLYVGLDTDVTDRVRKAEVDAAARLIADQLGDGLLLVFTNTSASQLHFILPKFEGARPTLRRMVVERDLPQRTAVERVATIFWKHRDIGIISRALNEAFDVEPVTKDFFAEYKRIFENAMGTVTGFGEQEAENKRTFVQTLFNRLMFVYFLSRKGWLRFGGNADYLNALWQDYGKGLGDGNFHRDRLRPLFFSGLNNPNSRDLTEGLRTVIGDVPFLNGGLFEETDLDRRDGVTVPDEAIRQVLTGLFDRFNFTVMESTPFDIEVAVDPEMLGKVFEELVTGRHDSGAYYTPRPVVSFMCREALKGYLEGQDTGIEAEAIARFVDHHHTGGIGVAQARRVAEALAEVTVVDPACGSGAYLLGMMQELIELQTRLFNVTQDAKSLYDLKLEIIQRNLYGVDIDDFAVNIAMLRLWLSLAIDYEGATPEPLPNLDFKVVCGDSLLGPDPSSGAEVQGGLGYSQDKVQLLGRLKSEFMRAKPGHGKERLRADIDSAKAEIRESLGVVADAEVLNWRVELAEVFAARHGFDIVIANPPYVVVKDPHMRELYKEGVYGRMNLYGLFIQRSLQLLKDGGQLQFINPRTLLTDRYFTNLRKVISQKSELRGVVLIADRHNTFERVLQECIILHLAKKGEPSESYTVNTRAISIPSDLNEENTAFSTRSERVLLGSEYHGTFLIGTSEFDYFVFEQMNSVGAKLEDWGLKAETGKVQFDKYREFVQPNGTDDACRLIWAENVQRYALAPTVRRVGREWLKKSVTGVIAPSITGAGIVTQRITANEQPRRIIATLIRPEDTGTEYVYSENHTNFIPLKKNSTGLLILAVLNSSPVEFLFRRLNSNTQVSAGELNGLPLPRMPIVDKVLEDIESLVSNLLEWNGVECAPENFARALEHERRLDFLIGSLYGFSMEEVERIQTTLPSHKSVYDPTGEKEAAALPLDESPGGTGSAAPSEERPRFEVVPNKGGLAPGVTPENLKDVIFELEDQEFLEKLGL